MTQTPLGDYDLDPFGNSDPLPDLSGAPEEDDYELDPFGNSDPLPDLSGEADVNDYELDPWGEGWENRLNTP